MKPLSNSLLIFLLAWGILLGTAYNTYVHYDFSYGVDSKGYLRMAKGDYDVSITRRYRVIVPWAAAIVAYPMTRAYEKIWPHRAARDWPYRIGFLLVNSVIMGLLGLTLFRIARAYGLSPPTAIISMLAVLSSRWANYATALPLTDSLFWLLIAMMIYALKTQRFNWLLILVLLLGPLSKESFLLLLPLPLLFSQMTRWRQLVWMAAGVLLALAVRFWLDTRYGVPMTASVENAISHTDNVKLALHRIFALRGIGELMTVLGGFSLIVLSGFFGGKVARQKWLSSVDTLLWSLLLIAVIHALLSGSVARMLYLATPFWIVVLGSVLDRHPWYGSYRRLVGLAQKVP